MSLHAKGVGVGTRSGQSGKPLKGHLRREAGAGVGARTNFGLLRLLTLARAFPPCGPRTRAKLHELKGSWHVEGGARRVILHIFCCYE